MPWNHNNVRFQCRCKLLKLLVDLGFRLAQLTDEHRDRGAGAVEACGRLKLAELFRPVENADRVKSL